MLEKGKKKESSECVVKKNEIGLLLNAVTFLQFLMIILDIL